MRGEMNSRVAMSVFGNPSLTSCTTSRSAGVSAAYPGTGSFAFAPTALRVRDRLVGRQSGPIGPGGLEVVGAHRVTEFIEQLRVIGVEDLEADFAYAFPQRLGRAEQTRGLAVTFSGCRQLGKALHDVGNSRARPGVSGDRQRFVQVALGLLHLTLHDLDAGTCRQRGREITALGTRDVLVGPPTRRFQVPAGQRRERGSGHHSLHVRRCRYPACRLIAKSGRFCIARHQARGRGN